MKELKIPMGMTTEQFAEHLSMMRDRVINFKDYGGSMVGTRQDRSYANQKRGNFHGNVQKTARKQLQELGINVKSDGRLKKGKWDG
jgi:hypothetical protein